MTAVPFARSTLRAVALFMLVCGAASAATLSGSPILVAAGGATPAVARSASGDFVVTWRDDNSSTIRAQRYSADAAAIGPSFAVTAATASDARDPQVAADAAGNFVIVWHEQDPLNPGKRRVEARRFAADGTARGAAFLVESGANQADVAMSSAGDFVIAAGRNTPLSRIPGVSLGFSSTIDAYRYHADGSRNGLVITVDRRIDAGNSGIRPQLQFDLDALTANPDGGFTIVWQRTAYQLNVSTALAAVTVLVQRFNAAGKAATPEIEVDSVSTDLFSVFDDKTFYIRAKLASDASGAFGLCWENGNPFGSYMRSAPIKARVWEADGTPRFDAVTVSSDPATAQDNSCAISLSSGGKLVVGWHNEALGSTQVRTLGRDGSALGAALTLTQPVAQATGRPDFGIDAADRPVIVDVVNASSATVRAQRLAAP